MTECMGASLSTFYMNTCLHQMFMDKCAYCTGMKCCKGRFHTNKNMIRFSMRPSIPEIRNDCFTDICKQGEFQRITLCKSDPIMLPVDVGKMEIRHITAPESESGNQKNDRIIPQTTWISAINHCQSTFYFIFSIGGGKTTLPVVMRIWKL